MFNTGNASAAGRRGGKARRKLLLEDVEAALGALETAEDAKKRERLHAVNAAPSSDRRRGHGGSEAERLLRLEARAGL